MSTDETPPEGGHEPKTTPKTSAWEAFKVLGIDPEVRDRGSLLRLLSERKAEPVVRHEVATPRVGSR